MRRGFFALIAPPIELARRAGATAAHFGLVKINGPEGMSLFAAPALPVSHRVPGMTILGDMFAQPGTGRVEQPPEGYWGNYVAFSAHEAGQFEVLRAPLTGMPLYWIRIDKSLVCFSHLALVERLGLDLKVDWDFVRHSLAYRGLRTARTGLAGVSELLAGTRLHVGNATRVETIWSPWNFVEADRLCDAAVWAPELEQRAIDCIASWAAGRPGILLELSGGLDSSIVAAGLAASGADFVGVTVATASADGDERRYARDVAERCGIRLIEASHDDALIDLARAPAHLAPRPAAYGVLHGFDVAIGEAMHDLGRPALFSGIGGDNVFAYSHSIAPALDAWSQFGPGLTVLRVLRDVAQVTDTTIWHAASAAIRRWRRGAAYAGWARETNFTMTELLPSAPELHPWQMGTDGMAIGKRQHVDALIRITDFLDRPDRWYDQDVIAPLLSQPLVELCLSIPSWNWIEGGRDRSVARTAFAARLPASVITRRSKGRLETMCAAAFLKDRERLVPLLLEGRLAHAGLLDRRAIKAYFARGDVDTDFGHFRLMEIADLELWIAAVEDLG